jgi:hypothetical protein
MENHNYLKTQKAGSVNYLNIIQHAVAKVALVGCKRWVGWSQRWRQLVANVAPVGCDGCKAGAWLLQQLHMYFAMDCAIVTKT